MTQTDSGPQPSSPPPPGIAAAPSGPPSSTRRQRERHTDAIEQERRANRRAAVQLIATPEWLALIALCVALLVLLSASLLLFLLGAAVAATFGWLYLSSGDALAAVLVVGGMGFLTAATLGDTFGLNGGRLWWVVPGLVMTTIDGAITYNQYRRRTGEVDRRILRSVWANVASVVAAATGLAWLLQQIADRDGRVTWPWFATVSLALAGAGFAGLLWLRRRATPADRRRYTPGRRLLPPPR